MLKAQSQVKYRVLEKSPESYPWMCMGMCVCVFSYQKFGGRGKGKPKAEG